MITPYYKCLTVLSKTNRPKLIRLKDKVRPGDSIVVESFSRLGRSTKDVYETAKTLIKPETALILIKFILKLTSRIV